MDNGWGTAKSYVTMTFFRVITKPTVFEISFVSKCLSQNFHP
jgi:hypothetical protein